MSTIYKYPIEIEDKQTVAMPGGARILCVQVQHRVPCLWAMVNPDRSPENRDIRTYGTGHPFPGTGEYIGTYQLDGGSLVFHVFEETRLTNYQGGW